MGEVREWVGNDPMCWETTGGDEVREILARHGLEGEK